MLCTEEEVTNNNSIVLRTLGLSPQEIQLSGHNDESTRQAFQDAISFAKYSYVEENTVYRFGDMNFTAKIIYYDDEEFAAEWQIAYRKQAFEAVCLIPHQVKGKCHSCNGDICEKTFHLEQDQNFVNFCSKACRKHAAREKTKHRK